MTAAPMDAPAGARTGARAPPAGSSTVVPQNLTGLIWRCGPLEQSVLLALSVAVFLVNLVPLELQRRAVNAATETGGAGPVLLLAGIYAFTAAGLGLLKLAMNVYRGRVSENAVRWLRGAILDGMLRFDRHAPRPVAPGVEVSLVLSEVEPIGSFVGISVSQPALQGGILLSTFAYLGFLDPLMAMVAFAVFSPQTIFVPLIQRAINRRVGERIAVLRALSVEIVEEPGDATVADRDYERGIDAVFALNMGVFKLKYSMNFLMNLMHHVAVASMLGLGGWLVVQGNIEIGTVVAFISGLAQINEPWGDLVDWYRELRVTQTKYELISRAVTMLQGGPAFTGTAAATSTPFVQRP